MSLVVDTTYVGRSCTFLSKNQSDPTVWSGQILAVCDSALATIFTDVAPYNEAVIQADSTVSTDITQLSYFILQLNNSAGGQTKYAFAQQWVLDGSFKFTDDLAVVNVNVYVPTSTTGDYSDIVTTLRAAGYAAYIVSTT